MKYTITCSWKGNRLMTNTGIEIGFVCQSSSPKGKYYWQLADDHSGHADTAKLAKAAVIEKFMKGLEAELKEQQKKGKQR